MRRKWMIIGPAAILGLLLVVAIGGALVQFLWNWLLPPLFGWRQVTFWQALGLLALCRILFGGISARGSRSAVGRRVADRVADRVVDRMADRWARMTPEEQERFRQGMRGRYGSETSTNASDEP